MVPTLLICKKKMLYIVLSLNMYSLQLPAPYVVRYIRDRDSEHS